MKPTLTILCILALAQAQTFTHNRFTEKGKTFSQDGTALVTACMTRIRASEITANSGYLEEMLCSGYVEGVADFMSDNALCIPPEVSGQQLVDTFLKYAKNHEDELHAPASRTVSSALREAYPCNGHSR